VEAIIFLCGGLNPVWCMVALSEVHKSARLPPDTPRSLLSIHLRVCVCVCMFVCVCVCVCVRVRVRVRVRVLCCD